MYLKIVTGISIVIIASRGALAQVPPAPPPAVFPDPLEEPPASIMRLDYFYNYSWRSFIALNWPAKIGAASRGLPDRKRAFGDTNGPRVWMTWKSRYEIFQPMGRLPSPWASYDGKNPCGEGFANDVETLSSFSPFHDFDQADLGFNLGNALVAQNRTYVRYEVRVNEPEFDSIVGNKWYIATNLPTSATPPVPFNIGSTAIKAAWRILNEMDTPANRSRYYVVRNAQVFDVTSGECTLQDVALVGFHIVTKTKERPQWIWSTFEHIDNVPGVRGIKTAETVPFSFNNPYQPQELTERPLPLISPNYPPSADLQPMQVVRDPDMPITREAMRMNTAYWNLPEIKRTVWQNYMLVMTQWPAEPKKPEFEPFPGGALALSNSIMETYFQKGPGCMQCHQISNDKGRDFVMFVTMDAFRPGVLTPGDQFSAKNARSSDESVKAESALSSDPMLKSLKQFFEAIEPK